MTKGKRGFASITDPERRRTLASEGGKRAHQLGRAHKWTTETAREAGRKGGRARAANTNQEQNEE